mgnify:FL=1
MDCGAITSAPVLWRVIAPGFPTDALSPRVDATGDVRRRVNICLELRYVAVVVWTHELRLLTPSTETTAAVARLRETHLVSSVSEELFERFVDGIRSRKSTSLSRQRVRFVCLDPRGLTLQVQIRFRVGCRVRSRGRDRDCTRSIGRRARRDSARCGEGTPACEDPRDDSGCSSTS